MASALTLAVVALLLVSLASIGHTSGYNLYRTDTGRRAAPGTVVAYGTVHDVGERIRIVLHSAPWHGPAERPEDVLVEVVGSTASYKMVPTGKDPARSLALAGSALLFAFFGLVVLWWGRDRTSFWLGTACAALAPGLVTLYGFVPEPVMLACRLAADLLTFFAFYALYAMAETVARDALRADDPVRRVLHAARIGVIVVLAVGASADAAAMLLPVAERTTLPQSLTDLGMFATEIAWSVVFCLLPAVLLALAGLRAATPGARKRSWLIFGTTLLGLSGIAFSIAWELGHGAMPHFETIWFSLLVIPIGFFVVIRAFGVIDVKIIINRILVVTAMTVLAGLAIGLTETLVHSTVEEWIKPKNEGEQRDFNVALQFLVGFIIVVVFGSLHHRLEEAFKKIVLRRRDRGIASLHAFTSHGAALITEPRALLARTAEVVHDAVQTDGVAVYEANGRVYVLVASAGGRAWPAQVGQDDPALARLRDEPAAVSLDDLADASSALGYGGCVFGMGLKDRLIGALAVAAPAGAETSYDEEETDALTDVAREAGDVLLSLRVRELSAFLIDLADGRVYGAEARARASVLREVLRART